MVKLLNRAKMATASTGTAGIVLAGASPGFQTFASAGAIEGDVLRYVIEDGANWEIGVGTYSATGPTLSRTLLQSSTGSLLNLSGAAQVYISATAEDFTTIHAGDGTAGLPGIAFNSEPGMGLSRSAAGSLAFSTAGAQRALLTSAGYLRLASGGIQFNGQTAAANALNAYEEGTWTPAFSSTGATFSHNIQAGNYVKIGKSVIASFYVTLNTSGNTLTANTLLLSLPFTSSNAVNYNSLCSVWWYTQTAITTMMAWVGPSLSTLQFLYTTAAQNSPTIANSNILSPTAGSFVLGTIAYKTST